MLQNLDEMQRLGKDHLEATVKSLGILSKSSQAIAVEMAEFSKKSFEEATKALEKMTGAKTVEQAIEIQTDFAKTAFESFVAQLNNIGKLYADIGKETYETFQNNLAKASPEKGRPDLPVRGKQAA